MHLLRTIVGSGILSAALLAATATAGTTTVGSATITSIGSPAWEPQGFALFSAPIGTGTTSYAEYYQTLATIMPAPNHLLNPTIGSVPGAAHAGPYGQEVANGVAAQHYKLGPNFTPADFSNGNGIVLGWIFVPTAGAPTGSSPDFASGPIIPNSLFKITQTGITQRNGKDFDKAWDFSIDTVNNVLLTPHTPAYDGYSHIPDFEGETPDFGPAGTPATGHYTESFTFKDTAGNGWQIDTAYTITAAVPLPATFWPAMGVLGMMVGGHVLRKRAATRTRAFAG